MDVFESVRIDYQTLFLIPVLALGQVLRPWFSVINIAESGFVCQGKKVSEVS